MRLVKNKKCRKNIIFALDTLIFRKNYILELYKKWEEP
jgi:hypothetical protein